MDSSPFLVFIRVNQKVFTSVLVDTGYLSYGIINAYFASRYSLQRILITPRLIIGFSTDVELEITNVIKLEINLDGYKEDIFLYVVPYMSYDLILGLP